MPAEVTSPPPPSPSARTRHAGRLALGGFAFAFAAWLVVGVVDTLVWLPQQTAPSVPLDRIYAVLTRNGSVAGVVAAPVLWLLIWAVLGTVFMVVFLPAHPSFRQVTASIPRLVTVGIGMIVFGAMAFFQWWSGFAMGNEVSDDLPPGAGTSTAFSVISILGGTIVVLAGSVLVLAGVTSAARRRRLLRSTA